MKKESMVEKFFNQKTDTNSQFQINKIHSETNHDWDKWSKLNLDMIDGNSDWPNGYYILQERRCRECGFTQINLQKLLT